MKSQTIDPVRPCSVLRCACIGPMGRDTLSILQVAKGITQIGKAKAMRCRESDGPIVVRKSFERRKERRGSPAKFGMSEKEWKE